MNHMATGGALQPTWYGHVSTTRDALVLFEACLNGTLHHVPRRPHDRERANLIKSGSVFIYEENASGIKRWTDGVPWSPSRILGNFLVYRELMKPFPPGEKKRATKRNKRPTKPGEPYPRHGGDGDAAPTSPTTPAGKPDSSGIGDRETERALIGSLVDSYGFKEGGLVKKTMSVNVHGVHHHLVSYYRIEDALSEDLKPPSLDHRLARLDPRADLIARQNFRASLDETDDGMQCDHQPSSGYGYDLSMFDPRRTQSLPMNPMNGAAAHGHLRMTMTVTYPTSSYGSAPPPIHHAGLQSYTAQQQQQLDPSSQTYYSSTATTTPNNNHASAAGGLQLLNKDHYVKAENYGGYAAPATGYGTGIDPPAAAAAAATQQLLPQPDGAYGRHHSTPTIVPLPPPRPSHLMDASHDHKSLDGTGWRGGGMGGAYSPTTHDHHAATINTVPPPMYSTTTSLPSSSWMPNSMASLRTDAAGCWGNDGGQSWMMNNTPMAGGRPYQGGQL